MCGSPPTDGLDLAVLVAAMERAARAAVAAEAVRCAEPTDLAARIAAWGAAEEALQAHHLASPPSAVVALIDALRAAALCVSHFLDLVDESRGVAGFHLNGDLAEWDEFDELITEARAVVVHEKPAHA